MNWTFTGQAVGGEGAREVRSLTTADLDVLFQPIVDIRTGKLLAHEALTRCRVPEFAVTPVLFEKAVDEKACGRLGHLIRQVTFERCTDKPLFINLHPAELSSRGLVRPDDPINFHEHRIYLEVTEAAVLANFDLCRSTLHEVCRRIGAYLVVDDYGAGHSDKQRVMDLQPHIVKIDGGFVSGVENDPEKQAFVRDTVEMCAQLGAKVVAEFIETQPELDMVRALGVDYGQGYLFAKAAHPPPDHVWPYQDSGPRSGKMPPRARPSGTMRAPAVESRGLKGSGGVAARVTAAVRRVTGGGPKVPPPPSSSGGPSSASPSSPAPASGTASSTRPPHEPSKE